ncbi:hypothetical protein NLJ89_g279 [Agrocybe chaxingu]|uniref:dual-specificity kinase n=1 Tax=Agrocybe chaxingu TaxID=84603 RepID=A0A9W8TGM5_9AGAR|nr:hypothetical protein NLJ89_g279 [Agrocybe chaxingu]
MGIRHDVRDAFATLGLTPDVDQQTAAKAYKKLALSHHPDRNHGDSTATHRFQQIGAAWDICQRHYDNPSWSHRSESTYPDEDDIVLEEDELFDFYMFMFAETLSNRYSRARGRRYRNERSGRAGRDLSTFSDVFLGGFADSFSEYSEERQAANTERQRKEKEEYEKRKRELELEIEQEERERKNQAKKAKADEERQATAYERLFQAAYSGDSRAVEKAVLDHDLDVNASRKPARQTGKSDEAAQHESLLHVAASHCDGGLVKFLIEKGASPTTLNKQQLTPFHAAIKAGNTRVVRFILERRGKPFESYHPSKATESGRTPLQLAIESWDPAMVELLIKHATTHDVEKCWKQQSMPVEIKDILRTKKGFVPPEEAAQQPTPPPISKKVLRQQEQLRQKEARLAEEQERAALNRQLREEKAARRAIQEQEQAAIKLAQEEARQKAELEERRRIKELEEARARELEEARLKAEAAQAVRDKAEAAAREKAGALARKKAQEEARTKAEVAARAKVAAKKAEPASRPEPEEKRFPQSSSQRDPNPEAVSQPVQTSLEDRSQQSPPNVSLRVGKRVLTEEERKQLRRDRLREKRKLKKARLTQQAQESVPEAPPSTSSAAVPEEDISTKRISGINKLLSLKPVKDLEGIDDRQRAKHEAMMRRRAEQSARDKERRRRLMEEKKAKEGAVVTDVSQRKRDRPTALEIPDEDNQASSDREVGYEAYPLFEDQRGEQVFSAHSLVNKALFSLDQQQFDLNISVAEDVSESEHSVSRSASATSSLDPYYFGIQSESESPIPPLPPTSMYLSTTPDHQSPNEPVTPARNPAMIDRRGLVGVGELATPRWGREERSGEQDISASEVDAEGYDIVVPEDVEEEEDQPDSPWTIEAVDGEASEKEEVANLQPPTRALRNRPSIADESGGEEILYPRNLNGIGAERVGPSKVRAERGSSTKEPIATRPVEPTVHENLPLSPPSSFNHSTRKARKRTSDEFEMDQTGSLVSKYSGSSSSAKERPKDDKPSARKHRSLNMGPSSRDNKVKERRRESTGLTINSSLKSPPSSKSSDRHVRQTSASSTSSSHPDTSHSRRVHTTDFSHLPPSPSSSSIQQFLRNTATAVSQPSSLHRSSKDNLQIHSSPNVAHSLLRGTQEGWSSLDDEATAEALRKLDGLSGKGARARASVGSFGRPSSASRPGTPAGKSGSQWEGLSASDSGKSKPNNAGSNTSVKEHTRGGTVGTNSDVVDITDTSMVATSSDDQLVNPSILEKTPKKPNPGVRLSFTPKRGSTSSTTYTSTPSSRDSASMSAATSVTSMSGASGRQSSNKGRRNSASSDISSVHSSDAALKDRVASIAVNGDVADEGDVPPVPPLPKDLSTYRSPPSTSSGLTFPPMPTDDKDRSTTSDGPLNRTISLEVPSYTNPVVSPPPSAHRESQLFSSNSGNESAPVIPKTPSKKWSFSSALNLKLSGSPSSSGQKTSFPLSPRSITFGQQLRKSSSKDQSMSSSKMLWSPNQPEAMASAGSLTSLSSVGSVRGTAQTAGTAKTPDRGLVSSRPGTGSSASTNHTTSALVAPQPGPLSPSSSVRRNQSKRLTPSSIPFFRRSSSQSMQLPSQNGAASSSSPTFPGMLSTQPRQKQSKSPAHDYNSLSTSTPGATHKKPSVLSLGLPSLLKSSSRRSLHADSKEAIREAQRAKDAVREAEKEKQKLEKEKQKKEEKDRSESRISVIINRKRGKVYMQMQHLKASTNLRFQTLSSTDPRKPKSPVSLPPMQISALEPVTAQRVAKLKSSSNTTPVVSNSSRASISSSSSRLTSQTVSSMQKQSDASLRSRNQLPTIAGSPSVGTTGTNSSQTLKESREPPSSLTNSASGLPKETPTKIPRISSRTSAVVSPPLKNSGSALATRRASGLVTSSANASPTSFSTNEFGVMESEDGATPKVRQPSVRGSPSASTSRVPRQPSTAGPSSVTSVPRKTNRESVSFIGLRKSSTNSVASLSSSTAPAVEPSSHHRFSVLSPSKGLKLLAPKSSARAPASSLNQNAGQPSGSPSSSRQSLSTPSPVPSTVDEEELLGDDEMMHYIRRQHAKKLAAGSTQEELDEMLKFPEPLPPVTPSSPASILKGPQAHVLSEFERKEILDYPSVYCVGANSKKKLAVLDNPTNNYGYDDERGDYLVVNHDHLAYRYEVIDSLGKGSFGQVLHCRDYGSGESVAIKIIRNKKRFHHQALVEIKILDSLRKWDADEKHHVIKMTEHFYFRNHLCIAMELLSINLYELIKANGFVGFTTALIRRFTSQMLMSLSLMRHHRIVHCDLKPEASLVECRSVDSTDQLHSQNVLLRHPAKSAIKVIDFGSSCFEHEKIYTYIQSRFYRSPEVILGMNYHMAIDMWSLGCILAELYTGFPIFPGENEQEQLSCIMEVLGVPDKEFINRSSRRKLFFDSNGAPRTVINSKGRRRRPGTKTLAQVLRCNDEEFVDFIAKCLVWDPERRIKPQAAMRHPFVTAGRKMKVPATTIKSTPSSTLSTRNKQVVDTPKKSLISAPTPLTARSSRTTVNGGPTTPSNSHPQTTALGSSTSRSYRSSQAQSISFNSSRTLSGYASNSNK